MVSREQEHQHPTIEIVGYRVFKRGRCPQGAGGPGSKIKVKSACLTACWLAGVIRAYFQSAPCTPACGRVGALQDHPA